MRAAAAAEGAPVEDYEDREQTLFRAPPMATMSIVRCRNRRGYTYFASDIAYHRAVRPRLSQPRRRLGADHGGYVKRVEAAIKAVTSASHAGCEDRAARAAIAQREPVKMSKRSGDFVTLREVVDEVARMRPLHDALRRTMRCSIRPRQGDRAVRARTRCSTCSTAMPRSFGVP